MQYSRSINKNTFYLEEHMSDVHQQIDELVKNNDVVLFMKGTAAMPMCGFSSTVAQILSQLNIPYRDINVLIDPTLRQGVKDYTNWPTIPQLYVKGEFIGGCDIVREMFENGELQELLKSNHLL
jgi:monothiol glutaredoxin